MAIVAQTNIRLYRQLIEANWSDDDLGRCVAAYNFALPLFATRFRSSGKPFLAHLIGVASLLASEDAPVDTVIAGLLHAVYAQGRFGQSSFGFTQSKRAVVVGAVGNEVAARIKAYDDLRWSAATVAEFVKNDTEIEASSRQILLMRLANEVEDSFDGAESFSKKRGGPRDPDRLEVLDRLAKRIGHPRLAAMLRESHASSAALCVPSAMVTDHAVSFSVGAQDGLGTNPSSFSKLSRRIISYATTRRAAGR